LVILEQWVVPLNGGYTKTASALVLGYGMFIGNWYSSLVAINSIQISQKVMPTYEFVKTKFVLLKK
jgi:hypothetical protein